MAEVASLGVSSFFVSRPRSHTHSSQVGLLRRQLHTKPDFVAIAKAVSVTRVGYPSPSPVGLGYLRNRLSLRAAVVSSGSEASTVAATVDASKADLDTGGSGGGFDGKNDGGGGGGGGGNNGDSKDGEGSDGEKRKMALSMSQKFTLGYAALVGVGGLIGYLKSGSTKSLLAGGISASLLYYVNTELSVRPVFASSLGLGISAALLGVMGSRFLKSGKIFPAGVVAFVSFIMTGGFLHGIFRSAH